MKIAIPTEKGGEEDYVTEHFGRAPIFTVYDTETGEMKIIENTSDHMGGSGKPPELLARNSVDVVICANLGPKAVRMFEQLGIKVYRHPTVAKVKDLIKLLKEGELSEADINTACQEHRH